MKFHESRESSAKAYGWTKVPVLVFGADAVDAIINMAGKKRKKKKQTPH
jgi:hypothetical protein